jgi:hypothetical protein
LRSERWPPTSTSSNFRPFTCSTGNKYRNSSLYSSIAPWRIFKMTSIQRVLRFHREWPHVVFTQKILKKALSKNLCWTACYLIFCRLWPDAPQNLFPVCRHPHVAFTHKIFFISRTDAMESSNLFSTIFNSAWIFSDWREISADYQHPVQRKENKIGIFKTCWF